MHPNLKMTTVVALLVVGLPLLYLVGHGQILFAAILVGTMVFLTINRNLEMWWMAAIALHLSGLNLGLPSSIDWGFMCMWAFIGFTILSRSIIRKANPKPILPRQLCKTLLAVVLLTASIRGWGLSILGSEKWGGMQYLVLVGGMGLYIFSGGIILTERQLRRTLAWMFALIFVPAGVFILIKLVPQLGWMATIFSVKDEATLQASDTALRRWQALEFPAIWAGVLALLCYEHRKRVSLPMIIAAAGAFIMMGLSGHRTVIISIGLTFLVYLILQWHCIPTRSRMQLAVLAILLVPLLYAVADRLPLSYQRAASVLPGIHVSAEAEHDAEGTTDWRVEMWKELLPEIPRYLLIGKGLGFTLDEAYSAWISTSDLQMRHKFFMATHQYHNGPLWLILDLGLAGFLLGIGLMIMLVKHYGALRRRLPAAGWLGETYTVLYALLVAQTIFFFTVIGGATQLMKLLVLSCILDLLYRSTSIMKQNGTEVQIAE